MKRRIVKLTESRLKEIIQESIKKVVKKNQLLEMARVDEPNKDANILGTKEIWVYGNDRSSMTPHFHYYDKKSKPYFEIEVKISDLSICFSKPRNNVPENKLLSWYGLSDAQKALKKWLKSPNADVPSITNYQMLKVTWNQNNRDNQVE